MEQLPCLLRLDQLREMGIDLIWSGETASFFLCAFDARQARRAEAGRSSVQERAK